METWIKNSTIFSGNIFSVSTGSVMLDDGSSAQRDIVEHNGGVAIVPIINDEIILIRQFRVSIGREIVEIPAGRLENNDTPESCAYREMEEEIGFNAGRLMLVHSYYSSVGFTTERMYVYLAFELNETQKKPEWDERIQIVKCPIPEVKAKLRRGEFEDSKTIIGLYAMLLYLNDKYPCK